MRTNLVAIGKRMRMGMRYEDNQDDEDADAHRDHGHDEHGEVVV